jgi:hypothetical protein
MCHLQPGLFSYTVAVLICEVAIPPAGKSYEDDQARWAMSTVSSGRCSLSGRRIDHLMCAMI